MALLGWGAILGGLKPFLLKKKTNEVNGPNCLHLLWVVATGKAITYHISRNRKMCLYFLFWGIGEKKIKLATVCFPRFGGTWCGREAGWAICLLEFLAGKL